MHIIYKNKINKTDALKAQSQKIVLMVNDVLYKVFYKVMMDMDIRDVLI